MSRSRGLVVQLGGQVDYVVTVTNKGAEELAPVTITNDVPRELDVAGVPVVDVADTINLITVGGNEQIIWGLGSLAPGESARLPWTARVVGVGDFAATNNVSATSLRTEASGLSDLYLAAPGATRIANAPGVEPEPVTTTRRVVTYERRRVATAPSAPEALPATGVDARGWMLLGVGAILFGLLLLQLFRVGGDRRRALIGLIVGLMTLAACVTGGPENASPDPEDSVLGSRVERGENDGDASENTDPGSEDPAVDDDSNQAGDPADEGAPDVVSGIDGDQPAVGTEAIFETVPVVSFQTVTIVREPPAPVTLGNLAGSNTLNFEWDEPGRQILTATSGIRFGDGPASLVANLATGAGPIGTVGVLHNESETERVAVRGRIVLEVSGGSGTVATLTSQSIDVVLEPGGEVTAPFSFLLPSGSYSVTSHFQPN